MLGQVEFHSYPFRQVRSALLLLGPVSVVLDEDGTSVEMEEFFQTLEEGTVLVVLTKGQAWRPPKVSKEARLSPG